MAKVAALWRYHVKGFTPENRASLQLTSDRRINGDRVWSIRSPEGSRPKDRDGLDYWPKGEGLCLRDFPSLAALRLRDEAGTVHVAFPGGREERYLLSAARFAEESVQLVEDSARFAEESARFVADISDYLAAGPEAARLATMQPLSLVGDGHTARFQDRPQGFVTAHNRASLNELSAEIGDVDEVRFRSNIAIDGWPAWHEETLVGSTIRIGDTEFIVHAPIVRCLAINANPSTGTRDARVLQELARLRGKPEFGLLLLPTDGQAGAQIHVGEQVTTSPAQTSGAEPESHQR